MKKFTILLITVLSMSVVNAQNDLSEQMSNMMSQAQSAINDTGSSSYSGDSDFSMESIPNLNTFSYAKYYGQISIGSHYMTDYGSSTYVEAQVGLTYMERNRLYSNIGVGVGFIDDKRFSYMPTFINYKLNYDLTSRLKLYGTLDFGVTVPLYDIKSVYDPNLLFSAGAGLRFRLYKTLSLYAEYKWRVNNFTVSNGSHGQEAYNSRMIVGGVYF